MEEQLFLSSSIVVNVPMQILIMSSRECHGLKDLPGWASEEPRNHQQKLSYHPRSKRKM
jgi:hypothetical protein